MSRLIRFAFAALLLSLLVENARAQQTKTTDTVAAVIETSLTTDAKQIRQYAFDGNSDTYFASEKNPTKADHFTLTFDKPVAVKSIRVTTGKPDGKHALEEGSLELSEDGERFMELVKFAMGKASAKPDGRKIRAFRVKPAQDMKHPLAIREFMVESEPMVLTFKYPVEFIVDVTAAPETKEWAEKAARNCERHYSMICKELKSDGFKPLTVIKMRMTGYDGVARAGGGNIEGSAKYFKAHPDDLGAMIHETVHCVQLYRGRGGERNPGWLVEGVADYIRFFKYEPGKLRKLKPEQAKYDGSYRTTAAFLDFASEKYDMDLVRKLNAVMRQGIYKADVWKDLTGKTVEELSQEWKNGLAR